MAKKAYIGIGNKARKVKKIYFGVANKARKVKKGYIGVGGKAKCFFSGGELEYYGTATALSTGRYQLAATTVGNYALFGGGTTNTSNGVVNAYNTSLTMTTATALSTARRQLAATTVGNYALFGGGYNGSYSNVVDVYTAS